jgi:hypothetical protein
MDGALWEAGFLFRELYRGFKRFPWAREPVRQSDLKRLGPRSDPGAVPTMASRLASEALPSFIGFLPFCKSP